MIERDLRAARDRLQKQLDALNSAIRESELRVPNEPLLVTGSAVITFTKHFGDASGKGYNYAAIGYVLERPTHKAKAVAFAAAYDGTPYRYGGGQGNVPSAIRRGVPEFIVGKGWVETERVNRWAVTGEAGRTSVSWEELIAFVKEDEGEFAQHALDSITEWQRPE